jgi:hypothetical protein
MSNTTKRQVLEYVFVGITLIGTVIFLFLYPPNRGHVYDCRLAEISPDYPIKVKEECRKLNVKTE